MKRPDYYLDYLNKRIEFCTLNLYHNPTLTSEDRKRFEEHRLDAMQKRKEYLAAKRNKDPKWTARKAVLEAFAETLPDLPKKNVQKQTPTEEAPPSEEDDLPF